MQFIPHLIIVNLIGSLFCDINLHKCWERMYVVCSINNVLQGLLSTRGVYQQETRCFLEKLPSQQVYELNILSDFTLVVFFAPVSHSWGPKVQMYLDLV